MKRILLFTFILTFFAGTLVYLKNNKQGFTSEITAQNQNTDWPQFLHDAQNSGYQPNMTIRVNTHTLTGGYGNPTWSFNPPESLVGHTVSTSNLLVVNSSVGKVYGLNPQTGAVLWSKDTGVRVSTSPAIANGKVIITNQLGQVVALDQTNGNQLWVYATDWSVEVHPKVDNGTVYLGSGDGTFHAIDINTGSARWKFKFGSAQDPGRTNAPILTTAAILNGKVYFGAENMHVYALNTTNGALLWARKVNGQSMAETSIVASSQNGGVVIARTILAYSFHITNLNPDGTFLFNIFGFGWEGSPMGTVDQLITEQKAITDRLVSNTHRRSMWELDANTGNDKFSQPIAVLWTGGFGGAPAEPVVDDVTNRAWITARSVFARFDGGEMVRQYTDLLKLNLNFNPSVYTNTSLGQQALGLIHFPCFPTTRDDCKTSREDFHLIGDEGGIITATQNAVLYATWVSHGGVNLATGESFNIKYYNSSDDTEGLVNGRGAIVVANGNVLTQDSLGLNAYKQ